MQAKKRKNGNGWRSYEMVWNGPVEVWNHPNINSSSQKYFNHYIYIVTGVKEGTTMTFSSLLI